jgi:hypothetical protein
MKILLVYPRYPDTFRSFRHVSKQAYFPPLELFTTAAELNPTNLPLNLLKINMGSLI